MSVIPLFLSFIFLAFVMIVCLQLLGPLIIVAAYILKWGLKIGTAVILLIVFGFLISMILDLIF